MFDNTWKELKIKSVIGKRLPFTHTELLDVRLKKDGNWDWMAFIKQPREILQNHHSNVIVMMVLDQQEH